MFTTDTRIIEDDLLVDSGHLIDKKEEQSYFSDQDALQRDKDSSSVRMAYSELSAVPLFPGLNIDRASMVVAYSKEMTSIAMENAETTLMGIVQEDVKNKQAELLKIVVIMFAIVAVVLVIAALFMSGKVQAPW